MLRFLACLVFSVLTVSLSSQMIIDGAVDFQTEPGKKFSLYIPSGFEADVDQKLIIGFHPLNVNRWDAQSWRDTLIVFAESVDAILFCPDGGADGKVDDPIDTAFTSFILDSLRQIYPIDEEQIYGMGFSWGGRTTYTYGLHRPDLFKGSLVIGAAINGLTEVNPVLGNASMKNFYIIHGSNDAVNVRFTPIVEALEELDACLETNLLNGVGHTIDFADRNEILKTGFQWLENSNCGISSNTNIKEDRPVEFNPNPSRGIINISGVDVSNVISINDINGRSIAFSKIADRIVVNSEASGLFLINYLYNNIVRTEKIFIQSN